MPAGNLLHVPNSPNAAPTWHRTLMAVLWPLAILTIVHRVVIRAVNGALTNDFGTVFNAARRFLDGGPVYVENLLSVDPHYLYAPSATVLLSPFAMVHNYTHARWMFILLNVVCILVAIALLLKMFGISYRNFGTPAVLLAVFCTESVTNTLVFTNINGLIFLCQVGFFYLLHRRRLWWAGVPMGLSLAIKPMLAPLLLIPLLRRQWQPFVAAGVIPVVAMGAGILLTADPRRYFDVVVPYMGEVRDYYNSSLSGVGVYYGIPEPIVLAARVLVVAIAALAVFLLMRYRHNHEVLWMTTTSGVILTAVFLISTLGQMYYSMMLIPTMLTVVLSQSFVRNAAAWIAAYGFLTMDNWESARWPTHGRALEFLHPTLGWLLLLVTITVILVWRYFDPARQDKIAPSRSGVRSAA